MAEFTGKDILAGITPAQIKANIKKMGNKIKAKEEGFVYGYFASHDFVFSDGKTTGLLLILDKEAEVKKIYAELVGKDARFTKKNSVYGTATFVDKGAESYLDFNGTKGNAKDKPLQAQAKKNPWIVGDFTFMFKDAPMEIIQSANEIIENAKEKVEAAATPKVDATAKPGADAAKTDAQVNTMTKVIAHVTGLMETLKKLQAEKADQAQLTAAATAVEKALIGAQTGKIV
jgi:hypothetical protein